MRDERALPCKMEIVYKGEPAQPRTAVVYSDFNEKAEATDATFTPSIPEGFTRIKILRHASQVVEAAPETTAAPAAK
jgi:hypothetical protein